MAILHLGCARLGMQNEFPRVRNRRSGVNPRLRWGRGYSLRCPCIPRCSKSTGSLRALHQERMSTRFCLETRATAYASSSILPKVFMMDGHLRSFATFKSELKSIESMNPDTQEFMCYTNSPNLKTKQKHIKNMGGRVWGLPRLTRRKIQESLC